MMQFSATNDTDGSGKNVRLAAKRGEPSDSAEAMKVSRLSRDDSLMAFALFGAGVIHEVNEPLATALLSAQIARRTLDASAEPQAARNLEYAIESIQTASNSVRELCRTCCQHGAAERDFDLRDVLRFTTLVMSGFAAEKSCRLTWRVSREPSLVFGNPIELEIALANLVYRAIAAGAREVTFETQAIRESIQLRIALDVEEDSWPQQQLPFAEERHLVDRSDDANYAWLIEFVEKHGGDFRGEANIDGTVTLHATMPQRRTISNCHEID